MRCALSPSMLPPAAATVAALTIACTPPAPAERPAPRTTSSAAISPAAPPVIQACKPGTLPPPTVVVLDAGEAPRQLLRYEVDAPVAARFSTTRGAKGTEDSTSLHLLLEPKGPRCLAYRVTGGN